MEKPPGGLICAVRNNIAKTMQNKRIILTSYENSIMQDSEFLLSKRVVNAKIEEMWLLLKAEMQPLWDGFLQNKKISGSFEPYKISKGENYKGLPYIVLDYPRHYSKTDIFAYRAMFWWGNGYVFTLLLQGKYLDFFREKILENYSLLKGKNIFAYTGDSLWDYDIYTENYILADSLTREQIKSLTNNAFFKTGRQIPLKTSPADIIAYGKESFDIFLQLLA